MRPDGGAELLRDLLGTPRQPRRSAGWPQQAEHRARLTALLRDLAPEDGSGRLAVLGAGDGNTLAIGTLLRRFAEVHLFDADAAALARARLRHGRSGLVVHAPLDLSGARTLLQGARAGCLDDAAVARLPDDSAARVLAAIPQSYDVVLSACVLGDLLDGVPAALGPHHPSRTAVGYALVRAHLRLLSRLLAPGGTAVLATDVTSNRHVPVRELWTEQVPAGELLAQVDGSHLCRTGTGPRFLRRVLADDAELARLLEAPALLEAWRWRRSARRTHLVYALAFTRRGRPAPAETRRCDARPDRRRSSSESRG